MLCEAEKQVSLNIKKYVIILNIPFPGALRYKSEGRGFDSRWCHWNFSLTQFYGRTITEMSTRNVSWG
jgi:hypothetical protein